MMPVEFDVTGKVVFITGAGRGIGKGIAQVLAEAGADIALNALTPKYVEGTAAEIAAASGRRVVPVIADVTKADEGPTRGRDDPCHLWAYRRAGECAWRLDPQAAGDIARQGGWRRRCFRGRTPLHHGRQPDRGAALHTRRRPAHAGTS